MLLAVLLLAGGCGPASDARFITQIDWMEQGEWVKADTHIHSRFSDGAHTIDEIALKAREFGCDVIAITDHADRKLKAATPEYAEAITVTRRNHPDLMILAGLEWNVPPWDGQEHATVLVPPGPDEFLTLAEFKNEFDDLGREQHEWERAYSGLAWLSEIAETSEVSPVVLLNHPSRSVDHSQEVALYVVQWRKHSDVVVGLSGAPGHQKAEGAYKGKVELMDRWDPVAAEVGGVWDQLLARGENVWAARAPSDFHSPQSDYWPGEFSETWLYVPERTPEGVLRAYRAGSFFAAHGHIVRNVELTIQAEGLSRPAYPGETIEVSTGADLKVELSLDIPKTDWEGQPNRIDQIEWIAATPEGSKIILSEPISPDGSLSQEFKDLPAGFVLRARGRRIVQDGPDLVFYTNPIRVVTAEQNFLVQSGRFFLGWITWRKIAGLGIGGLFLAAVSVWIRDRLEEREDLPAEVPSNPPRAKFSPPRRVHLCLAGMGVLLLAVYGSLVPLHVRPTTLESAWRYFRHDIPWTQPNFGNRSDWGANLLLFIPISFCWLGFWCLDRKGLVRKAACAGLVIGLCLLTSLTIEFLQCWFHARVPSQNDVYAQAAGAMLGIGGWFAFGQPLIDWWRLHTSERNPHRLLAGLLSVYVIGLGVYSLIPLDLIIHPAELYRKYQAGRIVLWPESISRESLGQWFAEGLAFVPVGVWGTVIWREERRRTWLKSFLIAGSIAIGMELAQVFVMSRFTEAMDVAWALAGAALGIAGARYFESGKANPAVEEDQKFLQNLVWWSAAVLYAGFLVCFFCWPMEVDSDPARIHRAWERFFRVPMTALYWSSEYNAATQILRKLFLFGILGALVSRPIFAANLPQSLRRLFLFLGLSGCLAVGTGIELWQLLMPAHTADITDIGLYTVGAALGMWAISWWTDHSPTAEASLSSGARASTSG